MSKSSKRLPKPNFSGITHGKAHKGDFGGRLGKSPIEVKTQCEPTDASPMRMQYMWAAYPGMIETIKKDW